MDRVANTEGARQRSHQHEARVCSCTMGGCAESDSKSENEAPIGSGGSTAAKLEQNLTPGRSSTVWKTFVNPLKVLPLLHGALVVSNAYK